MDSKSEDKNNGQQETKNRADDLTRELVEKHELFHDTQNQPYIAINRSGSNVLSLTDKRFKYWLIDDVATRDNEYISIHLADEVAQRVTSYALFRNKIPKPLEVRICRKDDIDGSPNELWYDLGGAEGLAVHITKDGYKIEEPPIVFRRYEHQHEQVKPEPKLGGKWDDIFQILNLPNRDDRVVFTVFAVSCFIDRFPKPILLLTGTNGSGKSTPMRILHNLIDPSEVESGMCITNDQRELARLMNKHAILHFDNVDENISHSISNSLCRCSSGDSFIVRGVFTDDDDKIFKGQRSIMLNGIGKISEREDLLDRSLIIRLNRIPDNKRMTEAEIFTKYNRMKPYLLHEIFTTLTKVLQIYPSINLTNVHRLADFDTLGYAICEAMDGYSGKEWLEVSERVTRRQVEGALEASPTAQLAKFLVDRSDYHIWEGTATEMLSFCLKNEYYTPTEEDKNIQTAIKEHPLFPKNASALGNQLNRAESTLRSLGIIMEHSKNGRDVYRDGRRWIVLKDHSWIETNKNESTDNPTEEYSFDELEKLLKNS